MKAPAVTHPLGWGEEGRSPRAVALLGCPASMCQFVRQDGEEELGLLGPGGRSPWEPWEWLLRHGSTLLPERRVV